MFRSKPQKPTKPRSIRPPGPAAQCSDSVDGGSPRSGEREGLPVSCQGCLPAPTPKAVGGPRGVGCGLAGKGGQWTGPSRSLCPGRAPQGQAGRGGAAAFHPIILNTRSGPQLPKPRHRVEELWAPEDAHPDPKGSRVGHPHPPSPPATRAGGGTGPGGWPVSQGCGDRPASGHPRGEESWCYRAAEPRAPPSQPPSRPAGPVGAGGRQRAAPPGRRETAELRGHPARPPATLFLFRIGPEAGL